MVPWGGGGAFWYPGWGVGAVGGRGWGVLWRWGVLAPWGVAGGAPGVVAGPWGGRVLVGQLMVFGDGDSLWKEFGV